MSEPIFLDHQETKEISFFSRVPKDYAAEILERVNSREKAILANQ